MFDPLSVTEAAREVPDRLALVADGESLTYRAFASRVARAASLLEGLSPGARVAVQAPNGLSVVALILACFERGLTLVPLHPRLTPEETRALLDDAEPSRVFLSPLPPLPPEERDPLSASLHGVCHEARLRGPPRDPPLAMLYTSGTTGRPKGAVLSRRAFVASARASEANLGWTDDDRWLLCLPLCHVGGLSVLTRCVAARRPVVLVPRFEPRAVLDALRAHRVTLLSVVPTMLHALLDEDREGALGSLRAVLVGGAAASPSLLARCAERGVRALTTYGLTEACSQVTTQAPRDPFTTEPGSGAALPGVALEVVDAQGAPVPSGVVGRIRVRGPTVLEGYWREEARAPGAWFDTGDLGCLDALGRLHVHARRTDLIVTGGENVYPLEVEAALQSLPGVVGALVFGVPDETWGALVAAALVMDRECHDEVALRAAVEVALASHKRPRRVCFVTELPVRSSGKPDRALAAERFRERVRPWRGDRERGQGSAGGGTTGASKR